MASDGYGFGVETNITIITDEPTIQQRVRYNDQWLDENSRRLERLRLGIEHMSRAYSKRY